MSIRSFRACLLSASVVLVCIYTPQSHLTSSPRSGLALYARARACVCMCVCVCVCVCACVVELSALSITTPPFYLSRPPPLCLVRTPGASVYHFPSLSLSLRSATALFIDTTAGYPWLPTPLLPERCLLHPPSAPCPRDSGCKTPPPPSTRGASTNAEQ